jgi:hypothetical protein
MTNDGITSNYEIGSLKNYLNGVRLSDIILIERGTIQALPMHALFKLAEQ